MLLVELLKADGYLVHEAANGVDGIAAAQQRPPDVALVDIGLPGANGYEVARAIRASGNEHSLLVALTGYGQPADAQAAREAGFDHHLVKPVEFEALRKVIKSERLAEA